MKIQFNKPFLTGRELAYIEDAHSRGHLSGDGYYTGLCREWLEQTLGVKQALLTHSCTGALEMSAILAGLEPGDEVIMPSYTFVSTANAFMLRGAIPKFVDIRADTLNIDESKIEENITESTKAIVPVHYAGVSCNMSAINRIAAKHDLLVIEDAAQGIMASANEGALGSLGQMGTLSFHETKNLSCGEGGALIVNDESLIQRAEVIREKGTNRKQFFRGEVDKYSWVDIGSSYLPSDLLAAFLWAQMEDARDITARRLALWSHYHSALKCYEDQGLITRPKIQEYQHNAHMYYILMNSKKERELFIAEMKTRGVQCVFHYIPLHSSKMGKEVGCRQDGFEVTQSISDRIVRMPFWLGIEDHLDQVLTAADETFSLLSSEDKNSNRV
jgi:dTDP-4-amino-4,6-dideoxygalactose transaminase